MLKWKGGVSHYVIDTHTIKLPLFERAPPQVFPDALGRTDHQEVTGAFYLWQLPSGVNVTEQGIFHVNS